jgi:hypothetical protein
VQELRSLLQMKQTELCGGTAERTARLDRLEARLRIIEEEGVDPRFAVMVKPVQELLVASVRDRLMAPEEQSRLPEWRRHWPEHAEDSALFDWESEFLFPGWNRPIPRRPLPVPSPIGGNRGEAGVITQPPKNLQQSLMSRRFS